MSKFWVYIALLSAVLANFYAFSDFLPEMEVQPNKDFGSYISKLVYSFKVAEGLHMLKDHMKSVLTMGESLTESSRKEIAKARLKFDRWKSEHFKQRD